MEKLHKRKLFLLAISALAALIVVIAAVLVIRGEAGTREGPQDQGPLVPEGQRLVEDLYEGRRLIPDFDIPENTYDTAKFVEDSGLIRYQDGAAVWGVDVSEFQGAIDWQQVKDAGAGFAILRLGWRGSTEGGLNLDTTFQQNYEGATAAGLPVGVYFFSQAVTEEEAREEAAFTLDALEGKTIAYPVVFDWEPPIPSESLPAQDRGPTAWTGTRSAGSPWPSAKKWRGRATPPACTPTRPWPMASSIWSCWTTTPCGTRNTSPPPACTTTSTCGSTPTVPPCRVSPGRRM